MALDKNKAWDEVFSKTSILKDITETGYSFLTADALKVFSGGKEPRLLAKMDTESSRPSIFKKNQLSILPVENGKYVIFLDPKLTSYLAFTNFYESLKPERYEPSGYITNLDTIKPCKITSESLAIDFAYHASLLRTFTNQKDLYQTIRGRQRTNEFVLSLPSGFEHKIIVNGVQMEIDAGYENVSSIILLEAKMGRADTFHIRQLLYPYLNWISISSKSVIPIFFTYTNGLFYFFQLRFGENYGDVEVIHRCCYTLNEPTISKIVLYETLKSTQIDPEPLVPFPQANDIDKVIDIIMNWSEGLTTKESITRFFDFDTRQADYYANAAIYLGLLERSEEKGQFILTTDGKRLTEFSSRGLRNEFLFRQIIRKPVFHEIFCYLVTVGCRFEEIKPNVITEIIQKHTLRDCNNTTAKRRSSTVKKWLHWIKESVDFE